MKKAILLFSFLYSLWHVGIGQEEFPTRDSTHIFWQQDLKLTYKDYQGKSSHGIEELMMEYDFSASACIGLWSALDIPEDTAARYEKYEKVYFAPAFELARSSAKSNDSIQIEMQNVLFDICELSARRARRELNYYKDTMDAIGAISIMYSTVLEDVNNMKRRIINSYFNEVFIEKKEGAFEKWRILTDQLLEETKEWETTPEECYRLMTGIPIEPGYIESPTIIGPLFGEEE